MSFQKKVSLSMIGSRERQHNDRVSVVEKYSVKILPVAAFYGGNASGKTNFFKALNFAKGLIVMGTQTDNLIPVEPYLLDPLANNRSSDFFFEILIEETIYEFSFKVTREVVLEEKLVKVNSTSETILYHRYNGKPNFEPSVENEFLNFAFRGTRKNQLFLTNAISQNVDTFRPVYDWFKNTLELIAPDSRFQPFEQFFQEEHKLNTSMNEILPQLDTGIARLGSEDISFKNIPFPEHIKIKLQEEVKEGITVRINIEPAHEQLAITRRNGELVVKKLVTFHVKSDGTEAKFEIRQESDGTQRIIDLLPAFIEVSSPRRQKVIVIDEIDRSLHTLMTRKLIENYLSTCTHEGRTQLLFTTHDAMLMDQDLFRRDEIWILERDPSGNSNLISFSEYKDVRSDKDIRKSYLKGRLGGVPRLPHSERLKQLNNGQR
jgi:AAA15 family ATPase/GTPase